MRIVFVRHGEPDYQNDCLTELGKRQAAACADRLKEEGITKIYSSPMGRATETAIIVGEGLNIPEFEICDFMHEITWGSVNGEPVEYNGHPWSLAAKMAKDGWNLMRTDWQSHSFFYNNRCTEAVDRINESTDRWMLSLGYQREGVYYRCMHRNPEQYTIAVFGHGGSFSCILSRLYNLPFPYVCASFHIPFTGITIARFDCEYGSQTLPRLELACDGNHIRKIV